jgi:hypothetical protein
MRHVRNLILHNEVIYTGHLIFLIYTCMWLRWAEHLARRWEARNAYRIWCGNLLGNIHLKLDVKVLTAVNIKIKVLWVWSCLPNSTASHPRRFTFNPGEGLRRRLKNSIRMLELRCSQRWLCKSTIFWDVTPCSLVGIYRRFGGTGCLHIQSRSIGQASKRQVLCLCEIRKICTSFSHAHSCNRPFCAIFHTWIRNRTVCSLIRIIVNGRHLIYHRRGNQSRRLGNG